MHESFVGPVSVGTNSEAIFAGQNRALQLLVSGGALGLVFEALVRTVETDLNDQAVGAILVLDPDGKRLRHGAAPSLPDSYNGAIDGIEIGPDIGTCCAAAARNEIVVTTDIESDPGWRDFKALPLNLGLRAAWSMPIRSAAGRVLGTFGTYFRECREPTTLEREIVGVLSKTAAVAIEQRAIEAALRKNETFLQGVIRASVDCIKVLDLDGCIQWMSESGQCVMEVEDFEAIRSRPWLSFWADEATRQQAHEAMVAARRGELGRFQGRSATMRGTQKWWDVVVSPILGDGGIPRALLSVSRDITERKDGEEALQLSEERYRSLAQDLEARVSQRTVELVEINSRLRAEIGERQKLLQQLSTAEENERRRISRELHDQVGQHLTMVMLGLNSLRSRVEAPALDQLRSLEQVIEMVGKEVHDLALKLRPTALDDFGLALALAHYLEQWSVRTGVAVQYRHVPPDTDRFAPEVETTIYRLVLEALANVAKHAEARKVAVVVERCGDHLLIVIEDDGKGFDVENVFRADAPHRLGLLGMRERAAICGGAMNIESKRDRGTTVFARIPLRESGGERV